MRLIKKIFKILLKYVAFPGLVMMGLIFSSLIFHEFTHVARYQEIPEAFCYDFNDKLFMHIENPEGVRETIDALNITAQGEYMRYEEKAADLWQYVYLVLISMLVGAFGCKLYYISK